MGLTSQSRSSLFRLLMRLEWLLLSVVAIAQILALRSNLISVHLLFNGLQLLIFTILGRIAPRRFSAKVLYTIAEFGLVLNLGFGGQCPLPNLLFIVLVIRNCVLLKGKSRIIVTGLAFLAGLTVQTYRLRHEVSPVKVAIEQINTVWIGFFFIFGLVILFLHLLVDAALKERQRQEELAAVNMRLRQYALRIEELATEQERNRIARDIHDSLGHSLTVFGIHLEAALRLLQSDPHKAETLLREIQQLNSTTLQDVRQSVTALRTDPLQSCALADAIADLIADFHNSTQVLPKFSIQLQHLLSQEQNVVIYRIIQESLTNIRKHAIATKVNLAIVQLSEHIQVTIQDNGKGFELSQNTTGFGLQGMQERVLALSGEFKIVTSPEQGCCITVTLPL